MYKKGTGNDKQEKRRGKSTSYQRDSKISAIKDPGKRSRSKGEPKVRFVLKDVNTMYFLKPLTSHLERSDQYFGYFDFLERPTSRFTGLYIII